MLADKLKRKFYKGKAMIAEKIKTENKTIKKKAIKKKVSKKMPVALVKQYTPDLSEKEARFCQEYVCSEVLNATQAYLKAFPHVTYNTARTTAAKLLAKTNIKARINDLNRERNERLSVNSEKVLREIAKQAFYDPREFFDDDGRIKPISEMSPDAAAVISNIETLHKVTGEESDGLAVITKIKLPDKRANLELLGRYLKMFDLSTPAPDKRISKLLAYTASGKLSARDAAYKIQALGLPLPEVLRIELSKTQEEDSTPAETITVEELELRCIEAMENRIMQENIFKPERQVAVAELKADLVTDSNFRSVEDVAE